MDKKYELTDETKEFYGRTLHRIRALKDFSDVKKGELGGWVEADHNLLHEGNCWIYDDACVMDVATIADNATVADNAVVYEFANVCGNAKVYGNAHVDENAAILENAIVRDNAWISDCGYIYGNAIVYDNADVYDNAEVYDNAKIYCNAEIYGDASIYGNAEIYGDAEVESETKVYDNAKIYGNTVIWGSINVCKNSELCSGEFSCSFSDNIVFDIDACIYADIVDIETDNEYLSLHDHIFVNKTNKIRTEGLMIILPKDSNFGENLKGLSSSKNKTKVQREICEYCAKCVWCKDECIQIKENYTYDDAVKSITRVKSVIEKRYSNKKED